MQLTMWRVERVPSVPETAVIDTGTRRVVYVQSAPGVFDARAVVLGPRAGAWYPLLQGLSKGDLIVARGSFLIDAETRLNPKAAEGATSATLSSPAPGASSSGASSLDASSPGTGHVHGE